MAAIDNPTNTNTHAAGQVFERILPENCVEYFLLVIEPELQPRRALSSLEGVRKAAIQLSNQLTKDYIWQRDSFNLDIKSENGMRIEYGVLEASKIECADRVTTGLHFLHGITDYGDSIEDEWLIVYLIRELSKQFPALWARVSDSDGEFLLVEAANVLPKWLSPEIDANRAWIHGGQLRIIPLPQDPAHQSRRITLPQAIGVIQSAADTLLHSSFVEAEAFYRLEKYPAQIQEAMHHAMVTIPRRIAYVIHELPKALAPAVEAFYLRDPISLEPFESAFPGNLTFPPEDPVDTSVKFTKVLYAQLKSQQFSPPPTWQKWIDTRETNTSHVDSVEAQKKYSMLELGMKIACGFEMLAVNASKSNSRAVRELDLLLGDLAEDGDTALPSDDDITMWKDSGRDDDDSWMDIDFADFEKELDGKRQGPSEGKTFGDVNTQADLRKIVSRFEAFLNDDKAGIDGAEFDEMDEDDDEDDSELDEDSENEDRDVSFDEEEFARVMREMMGLPAGSAPATTASTAKTSAMDKDKLLATSSELLEEDSEDEEIRNLSEQMAAELNGHGALDLDPSPEKLKPVKGKWKGKAVESSHEGQIAEDAQEGSEDKEIDIDYNLAKNLLESFKGQAGLVGPVGTMLADMGIRLPRDEHDEDEDK